MPGPNIILNRRGVSNLYPNISAKFVSANQQFASITSNSTLTSSSTTDLTVFGWFSMQSVIGPNLSSIFVQKGPNLTNSEYALLYRIGTNSFEFRTSNGSGSASILDATNFGVPTLNKFNFVVGVSDTVNNQTSISVNAGTPTALAGTTGYASSSDFNIGTSVVGVTTQYSDSIMDSIGICKSSSGGGGALTSRQISTLYNAGRGMTLKDIPFSIKKALVAFWSFDGNLRDGFGSNNLTDHNGITFVSGKR